MGRSRRALVAFLLFTVACLVVAGWLVVTLGNISLGADRTTYRAQFADVTGLLVNDDVKIAGVTVGKVTGLGVADGGAALVTFTVDDRVELPDDSTAQIRWRDAFGLRLLYVMPGTGPTMLIGGDEVDFPEARTSAPTSIGTFLQRITPFVEALDPAIQNQVLRALQGSVVGREDRIRQILSDGGELTQALASRDGEIGRLLDNSATILGEYAQRGDDIRSLLDSLVSVTGTLARRNDTLDTAVTGLADLQSELGTLVTANQDDLRLALDALETTSGTLATNADRLDLTLTRLPNLIAYHRISRIGQWFNVRAVGLSSDYLPLSAERGARLPRRRDGTSNATSMFQAPLLRTGGEG